MGTTSRVNVVSAPVAPETAPIVAIAARARLTWCRNRAGALSDRTAAPARKLMLSVSVSFLTAGGPGSVEQCETDGVADLSIAGARRADTRHWMVPFHSKGIVILPDVRFGWHDPPVGPALQR